MTSSPIPALDAIQEPPPAVADALNAYFDAIGVTTKIPTVLAWDVWNICANADRANHTARADVAEDYVLRLETIIRESCKQLNSIIEDGRPTDWRAWLADLEAVLAASPSQGDSA